MKIVHLPSYQINPYQKNLVEAQRALGHETLEGGEGGNFLRTALFQWKADILHFHWLHPYMLRDNRLGSILRSLRFILEVLLIRMSGTRIAWTIHNLQNHDDHHTGIERFFTIIFTRFCRITIAHSEEAARLAEKRFLLPEGSVAVIPHPSYVGLYPDSVTRVEARQRLGIPQSAQVLLSIGRINAYKGIFDLLEAFQRLPETVHLVIAGSPENDSIRAKLEQVAANESRIHLFARRFKDEEMQYYFRAADVVVYPYRRILTSGAVILGMSFGACVVVPDIPTIRETVHPEGGTFFQPGDIDSLHTALLNALLGNTAEAGQKNYDVACNWRLSRIAEETIAQIRRDHKS